MRITQRKPDQNGAPRVSALFLRIFAGHARRYLRARFHSIRILRRALPPVTGRPLVIYLNHASWWDPLVCLLLSRRWFADSVSFAPIDAAMLGRYGLFRRLGFYGIERNSAGGARRFLRVTRSILASPGNMVWLTPQGRFTDARERPLVFQPGLGALPALAENAMFAPLAIEYAFWTEPLPEILVSFGEPILPSNEPPRNAAGWTKRFTDALETTQDELAARSRRRDAADWLVLDSGRSGVNAVYDAWGRLRAKLRGEAFTPEHRPEERWR